MSPRMQRLRAEIASDPHVARHRQGSASRLACRDAQAPAAPAPVSTSAIVAVSKVVLYDLSIVRGSPSGGLDST